MSDEVKKYFMTLLNKVSGLKSIIIADRDGVPVLRLSNDKDSKLINRGEQQFLATFTIANEQSSKIKGNCTSLISMFQKNVVVQLNKSPLSVTFIGTENCNTGHLLSFENEIDKYLEEYKIILDHNLM